MHMHEGDQEADIRRRHDDTLLLLLLLFFFFQNFESSLFFFSLWPFKKKGKFLYLFS